MESGVALIQALQNQVEIANTILQKYGIKMSLKEIILHYVECPDTCIAYVYTIECEYKEICDKLREQIKAQVEANE